MAQHDNSAQGGSLAILCTALTWRKRAASQELNNVTSHPKLQKHNFLWQKIARDFSADMIEFSNAKCFILFYQSLFGLIARTVDVYAAYAKTTQFSVRSLGHVHSIPFPFWGNLVHHHQIHLPPSPVSYSLCNGLLTNVQCNKSNNASHCRVDIGNTSS